MSIVFLFFFALPCYLNSPASKDRRVSNVPIRETFKELVLWLVYYIMLSWLPRNSFITSAGSSAGNRVACAFVSREARVESSLAVCDMLFWQCHPLSEENIAQVTCLKPPFFNGLFALPVTASASIGYFLGCLTLYALFTVQWACD